MGRQPHRGFVSFVRNVALGDRSVTRPIALCVDMPMCLPSSHRVFGPRGAPASGAWCAPAGGQLPCPKDVGAAALPTLQASTGVTDRSQVGDTGSFPEIERGGVRLVRADGRQREWRPRRPAPFAVRRSPLPTTVHRALADQFARLVPPICSHVRFSSPDGSRGFCRRPRRAELWGQRPRRGR